jgi:PilZ domain
LADVVTLARTARESLARGLNALQGDPRLPPHLVELAAPIAQAMGALHRIEASGGAQLPGNAAAALIAIQNALAALQAQPPTMPAVISAMEAVAGALGSVHALMRSSQPSMTGQQPASMPQAVSMQQPVPSTAQNPVYVPPQSAQLPAQSFPQGDPFRAQGGAFQPQYAPVPAPQPQAYAPPVQAAPQYAQAAQPRGGYPAQAAPQAGGFEVVAAELGAHSPSNFYKGLSGNDIVDHGGLFVSTYKLPKLGAPVRVRVSLPGGYEFEANAVVRWRREPSDSGSDSPPGFGAQFTEITPEARQLVYRYTRNREPMFHDDL